MNLEEVSNLLMDFDWTLPLSEVRPMRNQVCELLGVKPPISQSWINKINSLFLSRSILRFSPRLLSNKIWFICTNLSMTICFVLLFEYARFVHERFLLNWLQLWPTISRVGLSHDNADKKLLWPINHSSKWLILFGIQWEFSVLEHHDRSKEATAEHSNWYRKI